MNFKHITILFILLSFSCKNSEANKPILYIEEKEIETPIITDEFKLKFLNDILSNKNDSLLFPIEKEPYINYWPYKYNGNRNDIRLNVIVGKDANFVEYLDFIFKEKDTTYISNQLKSNKNLKISNLSKFGHKSIDWNTIWYFDKNNKRVNIVSEDSIKRLYSEIKTSDQINLSKLVFNKKLDKAHISINYYVRHTKEVLYTKENGRWKAEKVLIHLMN